MHGRSALAATDLVTIGSSASRGTISPPLGAAAQMSVLANGQMYVASRTGRASTSVQAVNGSHMAKKNSRKPSTMIR